MSDRMPEYMPDRMLEYMSDKLSEYIEYMSKYTSWNVMARITRSKVFVCLHPFWVACQGNWAWDSLKLRLRSETNILVLKEFEIRYAQFEITPYMTINGLHMVVWCCIILILYKPSPNGRLGLNPMEWSPSQTRRANRMTRTFKSAGEKGIAHNHFQPISVVGHRQVKSNF